MMSTRVDASRSIMGSNIPISPEPRKTAAWRHCLSRQSVLLTLVLAVPAVTLRVWQIDALGVNSDEAVYAGQGASLAGDTDLLPYFPVFRAHPLLFQALLSVPYHFWGVSTLVGRLIAAAFGVATVLMIYLIGKLLYGSRAGYVAAMIAAAMPYLVLVNRQILLDGPMTFFATLSLYLMCRYASDGRHVWLYAAAGTLGLTFLSKETAILLLGGVYAFLALTPSIALRVRHLIGATALYFAVISVYPLAVLLSGARGTGENFLVWQLLRRANHSWTFYPTVVPPALGIPVVVAAVAGAWFLRKQSSWRESLLVWWIMGPVIFFEIWAVKGFQYLLPISAPVAILAARALCAIPGQTIHLRGRRLPRQALFHSATAVTVAWLLISSVIAIRPAAAGTDFLAGTGGVPGGREAGQWVNANVPEGAQMLALGPSMANIIQFYGHRKTYGLSVSPNPLHRNPVYEPVYNPDLQIRHNNLQYIVWDSFSAARSPFFAENLMTYVERYNGQAVHTETVEARSADGSSVRESVIVIYRVRP